MPKLAFHVAPIGALPSIQEHGLIPKIGPRSREIGEAEPRIYLFESLDMAEDAVGGWLGDAFEEAAIPGIVYLQVDLTGTEGAVEFDGFSLASRSPISCDRLQVLKTETFS